LPVDLVARDVDVRPRDREAVLREERDEAALQHRRRRFVLNAVEELAGGRASEHKLMRVGAKGRALWRRHRLVRAPMPPRSLIATFASAVL
jgi:hypothetical protein